MTRLGAIVLAVAGLSAGQGRQTFTGVITDSECGSAIHRASVNVKQMKSARDHASKRGLARTRRAVNSNNHKSVVSGQWSVVSKFSFSTDH